MLARNLLAPCLPPLCMPPAWKPQVATPNPFAMLTEADMATNEHVQTVHINDKHANGCKSDTHAASMCLSTPPHWLPLAAAKAMVTAVEPRQAVSGSGKPVQMWDLTHNARDQPALLLPLNLLLAQKPQITTPNPYAVLTDTGTPPPFQNSKCLQKVHGFGEHANMHTLHKCAVWIPPCCSISSLLLHPTLPELQQHLNRWQVDPAIMQERNSPGMTVAAICHLCRSC